MGGGYFPTEYFRKPHFLKMYHPKVFFTRVYFSNVYIELHSKNVGNDNLHQVKLWWAEVGRMVALSCSLLLPLTPAPSLTCPKTGVATASPSCLGGGWSSVGEEMQLFISPLVVLLTLAYLGLEATPAGLTSTQ